MLACIGIYHRQNLPVKVLVDFAQIKVVSGVHAPGGCSQEEARAFDDS
jgi:hypothetical protein